jgi:hypothetical protein
MLGGFVSTLISGNQIQHIQNVLRIDDSRGGHVRRLVSVHPAHMSPVQLPLLPLGYALPAQTASAVGPQEAMRALLTVHADCHRLLPAIAAQHPTAGQHGLTQLPLPAPQVGEVPVLGIVAEGESIGRPTLGTCLVGEESILHGITPGSRIGIGLLSRLMFGEPQRLVVDTRIISPPFISVDL